MPDIDIAANPAVQAMLSPPPDESYDARWVREHPTFMSRIEGAPGKLWHDFVRQPVADFRDLYGKFLQNPNGDITPEMAGKAFSIAGTAAAGASPFAENGAVGIFGGRLAKTADRAALARAERMAAKGDEPADIWNETGWFQGKDNKWRFEISDDKSKFKGLLQGGNRKLNQVIEHPDLFLAYPDLKKAAFSSDRGYMGGSYMPPLVRFPARPDDPWYTKLFPRTEDPERLQVGSDEPNPHSVLLHEIEHSIQRREDFSPGAVPQHDWEHYVNAAGEVEPRNVQTRMNMTPEERRANPPWTTEDVPRDKQIVREQNGDPQNSIELIPVDHDPFEVMQ